MSRTSTNIRRAKCPNDWCGKPLLFNSTTKSVQCRMCELQFPVEELSNFEETKTPEEEFDWLTWKAMVEEKLGDSAPGRSRIVNRMIDGVAGIGHCNVLWPYFDRFGVDVDGGVKRLRDTGLLEPFNTTILSNYAFGIREEHFIVSGYGVDFSAMQHLWKAIVAIGHKNGRRGPVLVPLTTKDTEWLWNTASLVSKGCTGREIFTRVIVRQTMEHLLQYRDEYARRASNEFPWTWEKIKSVDYWNKTDRDKTDIVLPELPFSCDLDMAAMANALGRSILMLEEESPFISAIYVPFLWPPDECVDANGLKRSPLILAWADGTCRNRVILVPEAEPSGISPVRLPRSWFKSVWGVPDQSTASEVIEKYLPFDDDRMCVVSGGKYFKPEFMRQYVVAFENAYLKKNGVHPFVVCEYSWDISKKLHDGLAETVMREGSEGLIWRCVRCERLASGSLQLACSECTSSKCMRKQHLDGTVEYQNGDHTMTPALYSWCFTKRKHWYNGKEYDNPPLSLELKLTLDGVRSIREKVLWFSSESQASLNTTPSQVVDEMIRKYPSSVDREVFRKLLEPQIVSQTSPGASLNHKRNHMRECLGMSLEKLLDDCLSLEDNETERVGPESIESLFNELSVAYCEHNQHEIGLRVAVTQYGASPLLIEQLKELNEVQRKLDETSLYRLSNAMESWSRDQRLRTICSRRELFRRNGLFYHMAKRLHGDTEEHFELPVFFGHTKFLFSNAEDDETLLVCTPSGHSVMDRCVELMCMLLAENDGSWPCEERNLSHYS